MFDSWQGESAGIATMDSHYFMTMLVQVRCRCRLLMWLLMAAGWCCCYCCNYCSRPIKRNDTVIEQLHPYRIILTLTSQPVLITLIACGLVLKANQTEWHCHWTTASILDYTYTDIPTSPHHPDCRWFGTASSIVDESTSDFCSYHKGPTIRMEV